MPERRSIPPDHDLLIEIKVKVETLFQEVTKLRDDTAKRVDNLELNKVSIKEFAEYQADLNKVLDDRRNWLRDLEIRVKSMEEFKWKFAGGVSVGLFLLELILRFAFKK